MASLTLVLTDYAILNEDLTPFLAYPLHMNNIGTLGFSALE
jgi:hypothetical protein